MFQPVVNGYLLEVDCQSARLNASLVFLGRMCSELPREYIQNLFADPAAFREGCECKVVWVYLAKTYL